MLFHMPLAAGAGVHQSPPSPRMGINTVPAEPKHTVGAQSMNSAVYNQEPSCICASTTALWPVCRDDSYRTHPWGKCPIPSPFLVGHGVEEATALFVVRLCSGGHSGFLQKTRKLGRDPLTSLFPPSSLGFGQKSSASYFQNGSSKELS